MTYRSNLGRVTDRIEEARRGALFAAAQVLRTAVVNGLRGGYKSGRFVTGNVAASVTVSPVRVTPTEGEVTVGTNVRYALYWELGHVNPWTRKYERQEVWAPALRDHADRMRAAYARVMRSALAGEVIVGEILTADLITGGGG